MKMHEETKSQLSAAQRALQLLYDSLNAKKLLAPEIKVIFHDHMNSYTKHKI
jgi:hypothetical protein